MKVACMENQFQKRNLANFGLTDIKTRSGTGRRRLKWVVLKAWRGVAKDKSSWDRVSSLATFICWNLWKNRNNLLYAGSSSSPLEILQLSVKHLSDFLKFTTITRSNGAVPYVKEKAVAGWLPPSQGVVKLNADAAFKEGMGGLGFLLRGATGVLIAATSIPIFLSSSLEGEALSVREGLLLALGEGVDRVVVESDCQALINMFNSQSKIPMDVANVVDDISHMSSYFLSCSFSYIPRECNKVAHSLARKAVSLVGRIDWSLSTPWLSESCTMEVLGFSCSSLE